MSNKTLTFTYSEVEVEAALCVWEELLQPHYTHLQREYGASNLRAFAIIIGEWVDKVYDLLPEDHNHGCFDWDFVPRLIPQVKWIDGNYPIIPTPESGLYHYLLAYNWEPAS